MQTYKTYTLEEATQRLKRYCVYRERCHKEVESKLKELRMIPEAQAKIIGVLLQEGFLNEERFAKSFARGKFKIKKWGKFRIVRELKNRDISTYNINSALREIDDEEYRQVLTEIASKKMKLLNDKNPLKKKKKLVDYLLYKGFEAELVYEEMDSM